MSDSKDSLSASAIVSLFFTLLSAIAIGGICFGSFTGDAILPAAFGFIIGVILDFFSGKHWVAKLAVGLQILLAITTFAAIAQFLGGMDH